MTKFVTLMIIAVVRLFNPPAASSISNAPFTAPPSVSQPPVLSAGLPPCPDKIIDLKASINSRKIFLQWSMTENETAGQFEIEKSTDGISFTMTAFVFATEKTATDKYAFYEKATDKRVLYRVKIIKKDNTTEYSEAIVIEPSDVLA